MIGVPPVPSVYIQYQYLGTDSTRRWTTFVFTVNGHRVFVLGAQVVPIYLSLLYFYFVGKFPREGLKGLSAGERRAPRARARTRARTRGGGRERGGRGKGSEGRERRGGRGERERGGREREREGEREREKGGREGGREAAFQFPLLRRHRQIRSSRLGQAPYHFHLPLPLHPQ